ncbi:HesA/MoeB/ThiF family protein [Thaumasiovibrio subtropicus]|uniref:HesA/MoeB/ThiF family protein n=1 Tax=Thaumasiovibrio subtropicus TaxID=1891207 RepID=UPI000B35EB6C|nr:HesA/MoeB/ThiF family protein [Thaumasiovibrio subtropicus]
MLTDQAFMRYNRQIRLPEVDEQGQLALEKSRVLIIGAGGLGSPAALYLAGAGVGNIVIADGDTIDASNLQRQVIYRDADQGKSKAATAAKAMLALNPLIKVRAVDAALNEQRLSIEISMADVILDCSDNFATRHAVNRACFLHRKVLISGAAIRWQGQLMPFDFRQQQGPCYHCLVPEGGAEEPQNCSTSGIAGPVVGIMGTMQALEAVKVITQAGEPAFGMLKQFDGLSLDWQSFRLPVNPQCTVCGNAT